MLPALSLFFLSFSSLAMEITLMRFYSVLFVHSYVYLLISLVMAGLGFGAVLLYFMKYSVKEKYFKSLIILPLFTFIVLLISNFLRASVLLSLFLTLVLFMYIGSCTTFLFNVIVCFFQDVPLKTYPSTPLNKNSRVPRYNPKSVLHPHAPPSCKSGLSSTLFISQD